MFIELMEKLEKAAGGIMTEPSSEAAPQTSEI
jgi:hypothetical protein